jgi:hypothetical protein
MSERLSKRIESLLTRAVENAEEVLAGVYGTQLAKAEPIQALADAWRSALMCEPQVAQEAPQPVQFDEKAIIRGQQDLLLLREVLGTLDLTHWPPEYKGPVEALSQRVEQALTQR